MTSGEKTKMRRRLIIKKSGNRAGLSMRRVAGSTEINGRHEGQFFGVKIILQPKNELTSTLEQNHQFLCYWLQCTKLHFVRNVNLSTQTHLFLLLLCFYSFNISQKSIHLYFCITRSTFSNLFAEAVSYFRIHPRIGNFICSKFLCFDIRQWNCAGQTGRKWSPYCDDDDDDL